MVFLVYLKRKKKERRKERKKERCSLIDRFTKYLVGSSIRTTGTGAITLKAVHSFLLLPPLRLLTLLCAYFRRSSLFSADSTA